MNQVTPPAPMPLSRTIFPARSALAVATARRPAGPAGHGTARSARGIVAGVLNGSAGTDGIALTNQADSPNGSENVGSARNVTVHR